MGLRHPVSSRACVYVCVCVCVCVRLCVCVCCKRAGDAGMDLRQTFDMINEGDILNALPRLTASIADFTARDAAPEQVLRCVRVCFG